MNTAMFSAFAKLSEEDKCAIVQMGMEMFVCCGSMHYCGMTTLSGASYYIPKESNEVIHVFLMALNGDSDARDRLTDFYGDPRISKIFSILSEPALGHLSMLVQKSI